MMRVLYTYSILLYDYYSQGRIIINTITVLGFYFFMFAVAAVFLQVRWFQIIEHIIIIYRYK